MDAEVPGSNPNIHSFSVLHSYKHATFEQTSPTLGGKIVASVPADTNIFDENQEIFSHEASTLKNNYS